MQNVPSIVNVEITIYSSKNKDNLGVIDHSNLHTVQLNSHEKKKLHMKRKKKTIWKKAGNSI